MKNMFSARIQKIMNRISNRKFFFLMLGANFIWINCNPLFLKISNYFLVIGTNNIFLLTKYKKRLYLCYNEDKINYKT